MSLFYLLFCLFILGMLVGSFLNVVAYRLPIIIRKQLNRDISEILTDALVKNEQTGIRAVDQHLGSFRMDDWIVAKDKQSSYSFLSWPPSSCPQCGHKIKAYENIPVISWLFLKGKCSGCGVSISSQYPIIEFITGILTALVGLYYGFSIYTVCYIFFVWFLIALAVIDYKHYILPDVITLPSIWLGLILSYNQLIPVPFSFSFYGVIVGYLVFWVVNAIFKVLYKKDGIGYGDFKLLAMMGAWLGLPKILFIILISSCVGAITGILLMIVYRWGKERPIPFGPYLVIGGLIVLFYGAELQNLFGFDLWL